MDNHLILLSDLHIGTSQSTQADNGSQTGKQKRTFSGIANSGLPFNYYGERAIVDMASIVLSDKVPALLLHDRSVRVGFGALSLDGHKLIITGTLLNNEAAKAIADEADDGFPWQMSAHVSAGIKQEIPQGETVVVNGQTLTGPITILKNCTIPEVSFTPTGVDTNTIAHILSKTHANSSNPLNPNSNPTKETTMSDNQSNQSKDTTDKDDKSDKDNLIANLKSQIAKLNDELKTLKDEKAATAKQARADKVAMKLSQAGFKQDKDGNWQGLSSGTVELLLSADDDKLDGIIGDIKPKGVNADYFMSEQYGGQASQHTSNDSQSPIDASIARFSHAKGFI